MADEAMLTFIREMMDYTDAQWETWKSNPRNLKMADNLMDVLKYKVVAEVTFSSGCGAGCSPLSTRSSGESWTRSAAGKIQPRWLSARSIVSMSGWTTAVGVRS